MPRLQPKIYTFTVRRPTTGLFTGVFPLDMLRYDGCYPATSRDVERIHASLEHEDVGVITLLHTALQGAQPFVPTFDRWASFGWLASLAK